MSDDICRGGHDGDWEFMIQGPGSRHISRGFANIPLTTNVLGTKLWGHVGLEGGFCSELC